MTSVLEEKDAIREISAKYCFYLDSGEFEKAASLFTEDCDWDGGPIGRQQSKAGLLAMLRHGGETATKLRHSVSNISITVDGHEARGVSYVQVLGVGEPTPAILFSGIYLDELVKHNGRWLFKRRRIRTDFAEAGNL